MYSSMHIGTFDLKYVNLAILRSMCTFLKNGKQLENGSEKQGRNLGVGGIWYMNIGTVDLETYKSDFRVPGALTLCLAT